MNVKKIEEILSSWESMVSYLPELTERELDKLLQYEVENYGRENYIIRIHARLSKLRTKKEREKILNKKVL